MDTGNPRNFIKKLAKNMQFERCQQLKFQCQISMTNRAMRNTSYRLISHTQTQTHTQNVQQMDLFSSSRPVHLFTVSLQCASMKKYKTGINTSLAGTRVERNQCQRDKARLALAEHRDVFTAHYIWVDIKHAKCRSLIVSGEAAFWQVLDEVPG